MSGPLEGSVAGPAKVPSSGPLTYLGVSYEVASFVGTRFPRGAVRIYVLSPG